MLVLLIFSVFVASISCVPVEVDTEYGRIRGEHKDGIVSFFGIPYATPPVGDMRIRSPIPPKPWTETRDCTKDLFFHVCPQFDVAKEIMYGQEDCLYANIYVPEAAFLETNKTMADFAVMFWIYGGGYTLGDGFEFGLYRGDSIAKKEGVIVVEHNYRLGALGLIALDELKAENPHRSTGNYALQDQQLALQFVHRYLMVFGAPVDQNSSRNIKNFGGNPDKVVIFGESAGAFSVCWHMVNEISMKLFSAAIMESGTCSSPYFFVDYEKAKGFSEEFVAEVKCHDAEDKLDCLRKVPADKFFAGNNGWPKTNRPTLAPIMPWGPAIDGTVAGLKALPLDLIKAGNYSKKPLLHGTNENEGSIFMAGVQDVTGVKLPIREDTFPDVLKHFFNDSSVDRIVKKYHTYANQEERMAIVLRDFFFTCANRELALAITNQGLEVYQYRFNHSMSHWLDYELFGDYHASELVFVFDQNIPVIHPFKPEDVSMSDTFTRYWTNMAKHGSPNGDLGPDKFWPRFNKTNPETMFLQVPTKLVKNFSVDICDFWATIL